MKSSSNLFPVELVSAEHRAHYYEDLYSLKPNKSDDKSVEIALLHLHTQKQSTSAPSVLFIHDAFHSHWQWMDNGENESAILSLLKSGFDIWLMDWRNHGSSKKNRQVALNTVEEMANHDLSSVFAFIREKNNGNLSVCAKGYGAQMSLLALQESAIAKQYFLVDTKSFLPKFRFFFPLTKLFSRLKLLGKTHIVGNGSEVEPAEFFVHQLGYHGWLGLFGNNQLDACRRGIRHRAADIMWLCSQRRSERAAKRLTGNQSRIARVDPRKYMRDVVALITSQSI